MVFATIKRARSLGTKGVETEGVETEGQLARREKLGCDLAQDYHFLKPLPPTK